MGAGRHGANMSCAELWQIVAGSKLNVIANRTHDSTCGMHAILTGQGRRPLQSSAVFQTFLHGFYHRTCSRCLSAPVVETAAEHPPQARPAQQGANRALSGRILHMAPIFWLAAQQGQQQRERRAQRRKQRRARLVAAL